MRWIVISLVVINIVVLAWQLLTRENTAGVVTPPAIIADGNAPAIKLLTELDVSEQEAIRKQLSDLQSSDQSNTQITEPLCTLIGPFPKLLRAEYFVERLAALDIRGRVQEVEIPGDTGFWVYLPPQDTRKQAFSTLRELQAKGIDSYVIPKGELENGISFGMFSQGELADQRLKDMRIQGYPAELKEITRSYREVWVVIRPGLAKQLEVESWQQLLSAEDGLERRQNFCPTVATE